MIFFLANIAAAAIINSASPGSAVKTTLSLQSVSTFRIHNHTSLTLYLKRLSTGTKKLLIPLPPRLAPNSTTTISAPNSKLPNKFELRFFYGDPVTADKCSVLWSAFKFQGRYKYAFSNETEGYDIDCFITSTSARPRKSAGMNYQTDLTITPKG